MSDNKENRGPADRARIALGEPYEVQYYAASRFMPRSWSVRVEPRDLHEARSA